MGALKWLAAFGLALAVLGLVTLLCIVVAWWLTSFGITGGNICLGIFALVVFTLVFRACLGDNE